MEIFNVPGSDCSTSSASSMGRPVASLGSLLDTIFTFCLSPCFKPIRLGKISQPLFTSMSGVMTATMACLLGWAAVVI